jgi:hypothetical protein
MRVIVYIAPNTCRELAAALEPIKPRGRAERLRLLATLGLTLLKEGSVTPVEPPTGKLIPALEQERDRIREKFGASLHL